MKKIALIIAMGAFTVGFAQDNKNEMKKTEVVKTKVTTNKGTDVNTKSMTTTESQEIALKNSSMDRTNFETKMLPSKADTKISYSTSDGNRYMFKNQNDGYKMMMMKDNTPNEYALLKPSTQNGYYIISNTEGNSFGYFNQDGNFIVEKYDPESDRVIITTFAADMTNKKMKKQTMKKDKMK
ncbi:hypothetical protein [Cochleicola gelatinilyticus]|uniref:Uncharacterized protein n=1 Tax=Cochleicola gelatinilyticus TaxID=1763537 RepID=A0A167H1J9_9FLAO|nr:hypothetical protein [Cochleicola gelatinilyticus]OAB78116.1 hypothetical protein ULVI_11585 [Cochleicola gelatinilyticus]